MSSCFRCTCHPSVVDLPILLFEINHSSLLPQARGRDACHAPDGLMCTRSWVRANFHCCFLVADCADQRLIQAWVMHRDDLIDCAVAPSAQSMEIHEAVALAETSRAGSRSTAAFRRLRPGKGCSGIHTVPARSPNDSSCRHGRADLLRAVHTPPDRTGKYSCPL
jgi:hypothetical protein